MKAVEGTITVSSRGVITIPIDIRRALNLKKGSHLSLRIDNVTKKIIIQA
ncbi:AbrB/MazE/SpoVT family DNA-binding domain-containing protein [Candidatus Saccharibacteria bacterium]|nr:AbrB/MazE/SpoVT family DNA-binding domain-containing protein [Candidatus Saccharibacteria bacterium]